MTVSGRGPGTWATTPTTTGKIERWHKTLRREFLDAKTFEGIADAQAQLDAWVEFYNRQRPHQSLGGAAPWERFKFAGEPAIAAASDQAAVESEATGPVTRSAFRAAGCIVCIDGLSKPPRTAAHPRDYKRVKRYGAEFQKRRTVLE